MDTKTEQLQIRLTRAQKAELKSLARRSGQDLSSYVLERVLPDVRFEFRELLDGLRDESNRRYVLAALNDFLFELTAGRFNVATSEADVSALSPFVQNYVAAMVEQAAALKAVTPPGWTQDVIPLSEPWFATGLKSLRSHLLKFSPVVFKRRNLFVDSTVGQRV